MGSEKKRKITIGTFDWIKGLGMICIVLTHMSYNYDVSQSAALKIIMSTVQMIAPGILPAFFLISGYTFKERTIKAVLKKNGKDFLLPYAYVGLTIAVLFPVIHYLMFRWWPGAFSETLKYILAFLFGTPSPGIEIAGIPLYACNVVWFMLALFLAQNLLNLILKMKKEALQIAAVVVCVVAGYFCAVGKIWYFCLPQGLMATGFCYLGYQMKKKKWLQNRIPTGILILLLAVAVCEGLFGEFGFAYSTYKYGLLDYLGAGCAGILLLEFSIWTNELEDRISETMRVIGRYSYWLICVHDVESTCIPWYLLKDVIPNQQEFRALLELVVKTFILITGCYLLNRISKLKYKKQMDKKNG